MDILRGMQYVQHQGELGRQRGQQNRLSRLAGEAYTAAPDERHSLLGQMAATSPQFAQRQQAAFQRQDAREQNQAEVHRKRLNSAATYMGRSLQSGNEAQIAGAWQAVRPYLAQLSGKEPPTQWDPAMAPLVYQTIAQTGGSEAMNVPSAVQSFRYMTQGLTPEQQAQARKIELGLAPRASSAADKIIEVTGADGRTRLVRVSANDPEHRIVGGQGAPQTDTTGYETAVPGANGGQVLFDFAPGTPQSVIDAAHAAAVANGDIAPEQTGAPSSGMPQPDAGAFVSPTEADSAYNVARAKGYAQTQAMAAQAPIKTAQAEAEAQAKGKVQAKQKARGAHKMLISTVALLDRLAKAAHDLLNAPGLDRITGLSGYIPTVRGYEGRDAEALMKTLRSQIGFGVLQNMRMMSPTGGALGQVSEKENELLQENLAALDDAQSLPAVKRHLREVIQYVRDSKDRLRGAYTDTYGDVAPLDGGGPPQAGDDIGALLNKYGVK